MVNVELKTFMPSNEYSTAIQPVVEYASYEVSFQVAQADDNSWHMVLFLYPNEDNDQVCEEYNLGRHIPNLRKPHRVESVVIHGRDCFSEWEYAAESAVDTIEGLGFQVHEKDYYFDVIYKGNVERRTGFCDGVDFKLMEAKRDTL